MYRVFLQSRKLIVVDCTEKEFRQKYPGSYELIQTIGDYDNIDKVVERLTRDYRTQETIKDYAEKKRWGWKYFTEAIRRKCIEARIGKPRPVESNEKVSATMRGKSNFEGKKHHPITKIVIASKRQGKNTLAEGQKWCHHPETGKELRKTKLPPGFKWGRSPEFKDYISGKRTYL